MADCTSLIVTMSLLETLNFLKHDAIWLIVDKIELVSYIFMVIYSRSFEFMDWKSPFMRCEFMEYVQCEEFIVFHKIAGI
jgi:hypothetical protein